MKIPSINCYLIFGRVFDYQDLENYKQIKAQVDAYKQQWRDALVDLINTLQEWDWSYNCEGGVCHRPWKAAAFFWGKWEMNIEDTPYFLKIAEETIDYLMSFQDTVRERAATYQEIVDDYFRKINEVIEFNDKLLGGELKAIIDALNDLDPQLYRWKLGWLWDRIKAFEMDIKLNDILNGDYLSLKNGYEDFNKTYSGDKVEYLNPDQISLGLPKVADLLSNYNYSPPTPTNFKIISTSGDEQRARPNMRLPKKIMVVVKDMNSGAPASHVFVCFHFWVNYTPGSKIEAVRREQKILSGEYRKFYTMTDSNGVAEVWWTVGEDQGTIKSWGLKAEVQSDQGSDEHAFVAYNLNFRPDEDTDQDGIPDQWEYNHAVDGEPLNGELLNCDLDGDGLSSEDEYLLGTDPVQADTDGDGMPDGWERDQGLDPQGSYDAKTVSSQIELSPATASGRVHCRYGGWVELHGGQSNGRGGIFLVWGYENGREEDMHGELRLRGERQASG